MPQVPVQKEAGMICPKCHGTGAITIGIYGDPPCPYPCPDCHGGVMHCCDGLQEQPASGNWKDAVKAALDKLDPVDMDQYKRL
jgi:hypothetical protein